MPLRFADRAPEAYQFPLTIRHLLDAAMTTARDQEIVYRDTVRLTYADLRDRIGRLATMLTTLGTDRGATVAVMDWDSHRYLEAYFAVPMLGAVLQTVNVRMPADQISYTLSHSGAEVLLVHADFLPVAMAVLPDLPGIRSVVVMNDGAGTPIPDGTAGEYEALLGDASPDFPFEDFDENALATTFYTTGTTGNPKGVCFSHRQLVLHALAVNAPFGNSDHSLQFGLGDVYMPLTPMFHVHAWGMPYIATMLGVKQVYPGRYEPQLICTLRERHGVTFSHCVPTVLQMVLDAAEGRSVDLTGWSMTIGGSALTRALFERATASGIRLFAGYGMSETCPAIAIAQDDGASEDMVARRTAAGKPIPLVSARVVDEAMLDVPHDDATRGELVLRAPWLTPCYVGDAAGSAALWRGGWLHTQDVATIASDGTIRIRDRLKDVIKTGGEWLDSIMLEDLLATVEGVDEVSVIAVPDDHWGERPLPLIVASVPVELDALNAPILASIAAGRLSRYARLTRVEFVTDLPRTSVGKIDKKLLRARFGIAAAHGKLPA